MVFLLQSFAIRFSGRLLQQSGISQLLRMSSAKKSSGSQALQLKRKRHLMVRQKLTTWGSATNYLSIPFSCPVQTSRDANVAPKLCTFQMYRNNHIDSPRNPLRCLLHTRDCCHYERLVIGPDSNLTLLLFKISTRGQFSAVLTVVVHCAISEAKHSVLLVTRVLLMLNKVLSVELQSVTIKMILKAVHLFRVLIVGASLKRTKHKARGQSEFFFTQCLGQSS